MRYFFALSLLVFGCQRSGVPLATLGDFSVSAETLRQTLQSSPAGQRANFIKQPRDYLAQRVLQEHAVALEARRREMSSDALLRTLRDEIKASVQSAPFTDAQLYPLYHNNPKFPYFPERMGIVAMVFRDASLARAAAKAAVSAKSNDEFRAVFSGLSPRQKNGTPEIWDFDVSRDPEFAWPHELVEPVFAARPGDILGPLSGTCKRYPDVRYYVVRVDARFPENNSFQQVKPKLEMAAMGIRAEEELRRRLRELVDKSAIVDDAELARVVDAVKAMR